MATTRVTENQSNAQDEETNKVSLECQELLASLPKEKGWRIQNLYWYQGFWCQPKAIQAIISIQRHYKAEDSDLIMVTIPKSGTTWLKALFFAIVNRQKCVSKKNDHPLLTSNPHELVPFLEYKLFANNQIPDMSTLPKPQLVATHMPISALRESIKSSRCKLVYLCRNPYDTFVSVWHYLGKLRSKSLGPLSMEEAFDMYCRGVVVFGPYWDHLLGYWHESLDKPHKVLFLKYEEMKENTCCHLKKLANFLGFPFTLQEEEEGVIEEIANLCSFEHLKELEVNKKGNGAIADFDNKLLFRKAQVGDWVNHLTPLMVERLTNIMEQKLDGSGKPTTTTTKTSTATKSHKLTFHTNLLFKNTKQTTDHVCYRNKKTLSKAIPEVIELTDGKKQPLSPRRRQTQSSSVCCARFSVLRLAAA